jgi:hypothetical protein
MKKNFAFYVATLTQLQFNMYNPKMHIVVGTVSSIFFLGFLIHSIVSKEVLAAIGFGLFGLPVFGVLWYSIVWKIEVDKSQGTLLFRNMFLQTYQIPFDQLLSYEERTQHYIIHISRKKLKWICL